MLPDVADDVSELATSVDEQVASLRGSLDAAIALKAQQEAEEKARKEAEEKARLEAEEKARQQAAAAAAPRRPPKTTTSAPGAEHLRALCPDPERQRERRQQPGRGTGLRSIALGRHGWGSDQFGCLVSLWNRESGWNYQAYNRSSGAFGIPQALPGSKMGSAGADWQTNAATQVNWGLGYIAGRYGSPCGAWGHSQSTGWY